MIDLSRSNYFNTLPDFIRESVRQSGLDFETEEELSAFVANLND